jgi:hypothetical protein
VRFLAFFAALGIALAAIAYVDWRLDPYDDRYHPDVVATAFRQTPPCYVAWEVVGEQAWPTYKLDLFERRHADVVVVGTSRVAKIGAWPGEERFVNLGVPGTGTESLPGLFDRLHSEHLGRLVVYVGTDAFWFGRRWRTRAWFDVSYLRDLKYLLSGQTLRQSIDVLRRAPGALLHPDALRAVEIDRQGQTCVVDRGNSVFRGGSNAWAPDGELWFQYELAHAGEVPRKASLVTIYHPFYSGTSLDGGHLEELEDALAKARRYGWTVVGFHAPISTRGIRRLESDPATRALFRSFRARMPGVFARYGFRFLDLTSVRSVGCSESDFSFHDDGHADARCGMLVRRALDRAAGLRPAMRSG